MTVRVFGIDAPEMGQTPWGDRSRDMLRRLLPYDPIRIKVTDKDRYGRVVGQLYHGDQDLGLELVRQGGAVVYARYNDSNAYRTAQIMSSGIAGCTTVDEDAGHFDPLPEAIVAPADISGVAMFGDFLLIGADEATENDVNVIQVLARDQADRLRLHDTLELFVGEKTEDGGVEMDIEGIAVQDDTVIVLGSHSAKRPSLKKKKYQKNRGRLENTAIKQEPNRGRIYRLKLGAAAEVESKDGNDMVPGEERGGQALGEVRLLGTITPPDGGKAEGLTVLSETDDGYHLLIAYDGVADPGQVLQHLILPRASGRL